MIPNFSRESWRSSLRKGSENFDAISDIMPQVIHLFDVGDPLTCAKVKKAMKFGAAYARPMILRALAKLEAK